MPITTGVLSFGLVSIPVKLYPAIKDQTIRFHLLHKACGSRVRNQWFCPACSVVVEREELIRGLQVNKGQYVQLTEEELDSLELEANRDIALKEFVPVASVDPVYYENSYFLGPEKGAEKPYRLLADALEQSQRAGIAELVSRGKEHLVIIRPYAKGLLMHALYYASEVRDFGEIPRGESQKVKPEELKLGTGLLGQMSNDNFEPEKYRDEYRLRVKAMLDEKVQGHEITAAVEPSKPAAPVIDLVEALKRSISAGTRAPAAKSAPARTPTSKKARRSRQTG
jgi:DNA end-binding protein Ku